MSEDLPVTASSVLRPAIANRWRRRAKYMLIGVLLVSPPQGQRA